MTAKQTNTITYIVAYHVAVDEARLAAPVSLGYLLRSVIW
jgi:hypothetical protein